MCVCVRVRVRVCVRVCVRVRVRVCVGERERNAMLASVHKASNDHK